MPSPFPSLHLSSLADGRIRQRGVRAPDVAATEAEMKRTIARLHRLAGTFVAVAEDTVLSVYRPCKVRRRKLLAGVA